MILEAFLFSPITLVKRCRVSSTRIKTEILHFIMFTFLKKIDSDAFYSKQNGLGIAALIYIFTVKFTHGNYRIHRAFQ